MEAVGSTPTPGDVAVRLGTALDALSEAVDIYRKLSRLTATERARLNAASDDLACEVERCKIAHQRLYERANAGQ